jgi:uncharacterized protein (TIGR02246 family)
MKKLTITIGMLVVLTFLTNTVAFAGGGDVKAMLKKNTDKLVKAMLADDNATIMAMYADDAYSLPSYSPMLKGKEAMVKHHEAEAKAGLKMKTFSLKTVDIFGNKDVMIQIGTFSLTIILPGQTQAVPDKGKFMTVWKKQADGSWKIQAETWNSDMNPMQAMQ